MTQNQIAYLKYLEDTRHNTSYENETRRHNIAYENETARHNRSTERYSFDSLAEGKRHNLVTERNQMAVASLQAQTSRYTADRAASAHIAASNIAAAASRYGAQVAASASRYSAQTAAQSSYFSTISRSNDIVRTNATNLQRTRLDNSTRTGVAKIQSNTSRANVQSQNKTNLKISGINNLTQVGLGAVKLVTSNIGKR